MDDKTLMVTFSRLGLLHASLDQKKATKVAYSIVELSLKREENRGALIAMKQRDAFPWSIREMKKNIEMLDKSIDIALVDYFKVSNADRLLKFTSTEPRIDQIKESVARQTKIQSSK